MRISSKTQLEDFLYTLSAVVDKEELPCNILLSEEEYIACGFSLNDRMEMWLPKGRVTILRRLEHDAEQKYKTRIEELEYRVRKLEGGVK